MVADEQGIVCYKRVKRYRTNDGEVFHTPPYFGSRISDDIIKGKQPFKAVGRASINPTIVGYDDEFFVGKGFIHTYAFLRDAIEEMDAGEVVYQCFIPKGTKYLKGYDYMHCPCFASKEIVFAERCTRNRFLRTK